MTSLNNEEIQDVLSWLDTFQLSRSLKSIYRDFSDGGKHIIIILIITPHILH